MLGSRSCLYGQGHPEIKADTSTQYAACEWTLPEIYRHYVASQIARQMTFAPSVAVITANISCYTWHVDLWEHLLGIIIPNLSGIRQSSFILYGNRKV